MLEQNGPRRTSPVPTRWLIWPKWLNELLLVQYSGIMIEHLNSRCDLFSALRGSDEVYRVKLERREKARQRWLKAQIKFHREVGCLPRVDVDFWAEAMD